MGELISNMEEVVLEPYSAVLGTHSLLEHTDVTVTVVNKTLNDICRSNSDIERSKHIKVNRLLGQTISSLTAPFRFDGELSVDALWKALNMKARSAVQFMDASVVNVSVTDGVSACTSRHLCSVAR